MLGLNFRVALAATEQNLGHATAAARQPYKWHSIGNGSGATYMGDMNPSGPDPSLISLPVKSSGQPQAADGWSPGCCLLLAGFPRCHLFITSLSQSDSRYPVDRRASSEAALAISLFHAPPPQFSTKHIRAPQREEDCSRSVRLSLPFPLSPR